MNYILLRKLANIGALVLVIFLLIYFTYNRVWTLEGLNKSKLIGDSGIFYDSAQRMYNKQSPYELSENAFKSDAIHPGALYCYLPTLATILAPVSMLPIAIKNILWYSIITFCFALSAWFILKIATIIGVSPPKSWRFPVTVGILALLFEPIQNNFIYAQSNTILLFSITGFIFCYLRDKTFLSGLTLGFGISLKFFPLIFIPYLFFRKEWKLIFITLISLLFFLLLPLLYVDGASLYSDFFSVLKARSNSTYNFLEFYTTFYRTIIWFIPSFESKTIKIISIITTISLLLIIDYIIRNKKYSNPKQQLVSKAYILAIFSTSILLIHPHSEVHIMIYSYPAFILTGMYALKTKKITNILYWGIIYALFVPLLWVQSTPITFISLVLLNLYCIFIVYFQKQPSSEFLEA